LASDRDLLANISGQSEDYRKGLVLGFTMAEIMLILLFLLLLLLGKELRDLYSELDSSIPKDSVQAIVGKDVEDQWKEAVENGIAPQDMPLDQYAGKLIFKSEADQLDVLAAQVKSLREQLKNKELDIERLNDLIKELEGNPEYIDDLERQLAEAKDRLEDLDATQEALAKAEKKAEETKPLADALAEATMLISLRCYGSTGMLG
jgi:DNA repair exonuclease SbcCD ATPase subunit